MNKDLEIIKNNLGYITGENCEVDKEYDDIIAAAERMAAEIEWLKNEVNETQVVYYSVLKESKQYRNEAVRLKAELRKFVLTLILVMSAGLAERFRDMF